MTRAEFMVNRQLSSDEKKKFRQNRKLKIIQTGHLSRTHNRFDILHQYNAKQIARMLFHYLIYIIVLIILILTLRI